MNISDERLLEYAIGEIENIIDREEIRLSIENDAGVRGRYLEIEAVSRILEIDARSKAIGSSARMAPPQSLLRAIEEESKKRKTKVVGFGSAMPWLFGALVGAAACMVFLLAFQGKGPDKGSHTDTMAQEIKKSMNERPLSSEEQLDLYIESLKYKHTFRNS